MLMTPMTPKVMARPIAASSSTEPSEMPYQTFWPASHSASVLSILAMPVRRRLADRLDLGGKERREQRQSGTVALLR